MMTNTFALLQQAIQQEEGVALATLLTGDQIGAKLMVYDDGRIEGSLDSRQLEEAVIADAREMLPKNQSETRTYEITDDQTADVYIESYLPPRRLVVVGAVHTAIPLVTFAKELGYHTTVIDARALFATDERFPHADELIEAWPDEALSQLNLTRQTDIVLLAHDPKFEDPALHVALKSHAGYIGAMGSKKTSAERNERLKAEGFSDDDIARIHGPIGINIGARSPAEIAISILAEIIAVRSGKDPRSSESGLLPAKADASSGS